LASVIAYIATITIILVTTAEEPTHVAEVGLKLVRSEGFCVARMARSQLSCWVRFPNRHEVSSQLARFPSDPFSKPDDTMVISRIMFFVGTDFRQSSRPGTSVGEYGYEGCGNSRLNGLDDRAVGSGQTLRGF
jgi:hypothetical protein